LWVKILWNRSTVFISMWSLRSWAIIFAMPVPRRHQIDIWVISPRPSIKLTQELFRKLINYSLL
jgi:hypothetical protein